MTLDPGHASADPDVQDGRRDLEPANTAIDIPVTAVDIPVTAVVESAIRAAERLRFLEAYRTIIARTAAREI